MSKIADRHRSIARIVVDSVSGIYIRKSRALTTESTEDTEDLENRANSRPKP
jgi:hypothetical protein